MMLRSRVPEQPWSPRPAVHAHAPDIAVDGERRERVEHENAEGHRCDLLQWEWKHLEEKQ
jgi:hypothetical protein